jgi:hypothetical protein
MELATTVNAGKLRFNSKTQVRNLPEELLLSLAFILSRKKNTYCGEKQGRSISRNAERQINNGLIKNTNERGGTKLREGQFNSSRYKEFSFRKAKREKYMGARWKENLYSGREFNFRFRLLLNRNTYWEPFPTF